MSHKIVDLSANVTGSGSTGSPFNKIQFGSSLRLTGATGDIAHYQVKGITGWNTSLQVARDRAIIESLEKTPARFVFRATGAAGISVTNTNSGGTGEQVVQFNRIMMEFVGLTGTAGVRSLITMVNDGRTSSAYKQRVQINSCLLKGSFESGTGNLVRDRSTGDMLSTLELKGTDLVAGKNVSYMVDVETRNPRQDDINTCHYEGYATPLRRGSTGGGQYKFSSFNNMFAVRFRNSSLIHYNYLPDTSILQYDSALDLSNVMISDQFIDSNGTPHTITQVWDGLDRIEMLGATGVVVATPVNTRQGSIVRRYKYLSVGVAGTSGSTGAIPAGTNVKDNRFDVSALEGCTGPIDAMTLPVALMPKAGTNLLDQGDPSLGITVDILNEPRGVTGSIGAKTYRLLLNTFASMPQRGSGQVMSTINTAAVLSLSEFDDYFDHIAEIAKVEMWYVHEDGRQEKHVIHEGLALRGLVEWTSNAKKGIWRKTRIRLVSFDGAELMIRGAVQRNGYEDLIVQ